jgi:hypothetical protein
MNYSDGYITIIDEHYLEDGEIEEIKEETNLFTKAEQNRKEMYDSMVEPF